MGLGKQADEETEFLSYFDKSGNKEIAETATSKVSFGGQKGRFVFLRHPDGKSSITFITDDDSMIVVDKGKNNFE